MRSPSDHVSRAHAHYEFDYKARPAVNFVAALTVFTGLAGTAVLWAFICALVEQFVF